MTGRDGKVSSRHATQHRETTVKVDQISAYIVDMYAMMHTPGKIHAILFVGGDTYWAHISSSVPPVVASVGSLVTLVTSLRGRA